MNILITGCAGFIGYHLSTKLLENKKYKIYGIDNLNKYYDVNLKNNRLKKLKKYKNFFFYKIDLRKFNNLENNFKKNKYNIVINLAAQAGVRYSISNPRTYLENNIDGFFNILECSRKYKIKHFLYASTSSVYGDTKNFPIKETDSTDSPLSFYAASKKCNEILAYSYSNIYKLKTTGMRFFTVYGEYGRPDMALFLFTKNIKENKKLKLFNKGNHVRDFTYIDDVVISIKKLIQKPSKNKIPYNIFNISSNNPQNLKTYLNIISDKIGNNPKIKYLSMQAGDVLKTHGDNTKLKKHINFMPKVDIKRGVHKFIAWYNDYFKTK